MVRINTTACSDSSINLFDYLEVTWDSEKERVAIESNYHGV